MSIEEIIAGLFVIVFVLLFSKSYSNELEGIEDKDCNDKDHND